MIDIKFMFKNEITEAARADSRQETERREDMAVEYRKLEEPDLETLEEQEPEKTDIVAGRTCHKESQGV